LKTQYDLYDRGMSRMIIPTGYSGDRAKDPAEVSDALKGFIAFFGGSNEEYAGVKGNDYRIAFADTLRKWAARNGHSDLFDRMSDGEVTDDWNYHIFPNVTLNVFSHSLLIQGWTPHPSDPEKCIYRATSLVLPVEDPEQHVMDPASFAVSAEKGWKGTVRPPRRYPQKLEEWGTVLSQDVERLPLIQKGLGSRSFDGSRLSMSECRIHHYLGEIDRYLGR
jgi:carnitine monooxygenase subunit